jgi:iron complex transport system permease protein
MTSYFTSGIVSLLMYFSIPEQIQAYINWTFGSFSGVSQQQLFIFVPIILIGLGMSMALAKPLNALLLGEDYARSMGVHILRTRVLIIASTAILAGTVTAFCGPIAFLGLAVPHLCRALFRTADHRVLVPATIVLGSVAALATSLIATLPNERMVLPLNAVTSLVGAPVIIWVIVRYHQVRRVSL